MYTLSCEENRLGENTEEVFTLPLVLVALLLLAATFFLFCWHGASP
jgi:hypothetical protein